ncbi:metallophosphoesterase family protein [Agarivorans sp. MS3-6]|uniref:metallophosphoesterase family protein n=1 Tax=Agarivorans sp. TSD2052 TaxID=2937286 RepID=UPI00200F592B|nr:metallophosphoesterase family protein [Agarivorans sp. TSD2052]UPW18994.1 metallophosphatase family protein [Agarivorans sp. TSD2052]
MGKFAVLSDIHSNVFALKAVVDDAKAKGVTTFINLGDILYGPIAPRETYDYLLSLNAVTISGNQDRQIYEANKAEIDLNPTMQFILTDLGKSPLEWMKQLPFDSQVSPDIYACHGTPNDDLVYLLENVVTGKPVVRADCEVIKLLDGVSSPIVLCGHTHIPRCVELSTGQIVINPGSVGLQAYTDDEPTIHSMQNYSSKASYATLQKKSDGKWDIVFHKVTYDVHEATCAAKKQGRADWVHFLSTGRCL